jgi:hypothetical protein
MLIMDQNVTTQEVLGELNERGVKFLALRMRSPALVKYISSLSGKDFTTITLDRAGPHNEPKVHEDPVVKLTSYPGTVRQVVVTGLGRDAPAVIITNDTAMKTRAVITRYARRMTIEQPLAEIIRAFCADALSSTVNLKRGPRRRPRRPRPGPDRRATRPPARLRDRHPRHHPAAVPGNPRPDHHHQRHHHHHPLVGGRSIRYEFA